MPEKAAYKDGKYCAATHALTLQTQKSHRSEQRSYHLDAVLCRV